MDEFVVEYLEWLFGRQKGHRRPLPAKLDVASIEESHSTKKPSRIAPRETFAVHSGSAKIVRVTAWEIEFTDASGAKHFVSLRECASNWPLYHGGFQNKEARGGNRCVGERGALDDPPWVQFVNERMFRFEFESYDALYRDLLDPLSRA